MNITCPNCEQRVGTDVQLPRVTGLSIVVDGCPYCGFSELEDENA